MKKNKLTQERLKELLVYFPDTGEFYWRETKRKGRPYGKAGTITNGGYRRIVIDGKGYLASNLAWLYVTGEIPRQEIDHVNRSKVDNRLFNLRIATKNQNLRNSRARSSSGFKHVYRNRGRWIVQIRVNNKIQHIGMFADEESANIAAAEARYKIDPVFYA